MADTIVLNYKLDKLVAAQDRLRHSSQRVYPVARQAAANVLRSLYLPAIKREAPIGRHFSDPDSHPYRTGRPTRGGGLRDAFRVDAMATGRTLARLRIADVEDAWGISATRKAGWVISGRTKRHLIMPKTEDGTLAFLWENAPGELILRQHGAKMEGRRKSKKKANYPATLVFAKFVHAGTFPPNPFHERAWNKVSAQVKGRLGDELNIQITREFS